MPKGEAGKILGLGAAATAIGGAYKFSEFLYKAKRFRDVGPANAVYVRSINRVRSDLEEVQRLLTVPEIKEALEANPPKAKWVYGAMRDTRGALENITPHTERVGGDIEDGRRVGIRHRLRWLLSEKEKLENREKELNYAHSSLNEVIGYLTALEPTDVREKKHRHSHEHEHGHDRETRDTKIDIDIRRDGPERRVEERDVWVEQRGAPQRFEERDVYVERHSGPRRVEERETWVDQRGPTHYEERDVYIDERGPRRYEEHDVRYEDRYYDERQHEARPRRVEERDLVIERDPRDPRHVEATYHERTPEHYEERRYEERRVDSGLGRRRPESFEDRVPERETYMQSDVRRPAYGRPPYGQYAEYGAPQPSGAAEYRRRFTGDPGFGDEEVFNPQPVPLQDPSYGREVWIEEKEDYTRDPYGNKLPERYHPTRYPQYPRSRL